MALYICGSMVMAVVVSVAVPECWYVRGKARRCFGKGTVKTALNSFKYCLLISLHILALVNLRKTGCSLLQLVHFGDRWNRVIVTIVKIQEELRRVYVIYQQLEVACNGVQVQELAQQRGLKAGLQEIFLSLTSVLTSCG